MAEYANLPSGFGAIISRRLASAKELETYYSYDDALDFMEIISVDNYNKWACAEELKKNQKKIGR